MKDNLTVHGVMLEVDGQGLLITGPAGIGKSELGLTLVCMGHRLVADDVVELRREDDVLVAVRDPDYAGFLALRDLGVINLIKTYGAAASAERQRLDLVLELLPADAHTATETETLEGRRDSQRLLDVEVPRVKLASNRCRPLARLAETAVRDQQLRDRGYRADLDLGTRQQQRIGGGAAWS